MHAVYPCGRLSVRGEGREERVMVVRLGFLPELP
jgi:hypothetical protein